VTNERRDLLRAPHAPVGSGDIASRADVLLLVRAFYREAAVDELLEPVFRAVHVDWAEHVPVVTDFWCRQLLGHRGYDRPTLGAHAPAHALVPFTDEHYERWLAIWTATVDDHFSGPVAELATSRARVVARAMRHHLGGARETPTDPQAGNRQSSSSMPRT
jgi:hemoglobin